MAISETQKDLLSYLDVLTREFDHNKLERHTTGEIAKSLSVSRNLCSQYLNDLVRRGLVVKAGMRPIYYLHRHDLERYLQASVGRASYATVQELLALRGTRPGTGFECAVGFDLSLSSAVSRMRTALEYPPCGLPVLIAGASGTGKTYMANLMLAYGKAAGLMDEDAEITALDCSQYAMRLGDVVGEFEGSAEHPGLIDTAKNGLLLFKHVDMLPASQQEYLFTHALFAARAERGTMERGLRFVFTATAQEGSDAFVRLEHRLPVVAVLPPLHERTPQECRDLALHFLRDEGRRMGVDVLISSGALKCLVSARYEDNISELRRSVTNACAEAYLSRGGANQIKVRTYNLPANVLMSVDVHQVQGDNRMLNVTRLSNVPPRQDVVDVLDEIVRAYEAFVSRSIDDVTFDDQVASRVARLEQRLAQGQGARGPRLAAFERLLGEGMNDVNDEFDAALSHSTARVVAQLAYLEIWPDEGLPRWRSENRHAAEGALMLLAARHQAAAQVSERLSELVLRVLGIALDPTARLLVFAHVALLERVGEEANPASRSPVTGNVGGIGAV